MPFYTFILEYKGGTYISQIESGSPANAFVKGAKSMEAVDVAGLRWKGKRSLIEQMKSKDFASIKVLTNVWCNTALIFNQLAIVTIIQTDPT